jgi:hypothetical protein
MDTLAEVSGSQSPSTHKYLVVVPTYNERETISARLSALAAAVPEVEVLVVDDSSPDGTADLVRADPRLGTRVFLLERPTKDGLGAAYRAGFSWALQADYDGIVQMDADLSHPPGRVPSLLAALERADVVIGSRHTIGGRVSGWTVRRRLRSWGGNAYVRAILGLSTHDCTAGFKAFRPAPSTGSTSQHPPPTATASRSRTPGTPSEPGHRPGGTGSRPTWRLHEIGAHLVHPFRSRVHSMRTLSRFVTMETEGWYRDYRAR